MLLQLTPLGMRFNGAAVFHTALVEQLAPGFGIGVFKRRLFIQITRHRATPKLNKGVPASTVEMTL
ncbi:hypothetical protein [Pseudomonas sp. TMP9]|uniref:hypothetical protein n=1 Tax=Pseudomonas sp. TMP9 TaxID=3133144 RepID=UPI0030D3B7F0